MRLTSIESSFHPCITAIVPGPGRTQGRSKCALGWLQKLTHVPLEIAILIVTIVMYGALVSVAVLRHLRSYRDITITIIIIIIIILNTLGCPEG